MPRVSRWLLVLLALAPGACRKARDPRAVERLVPLATDAGRADRADRPAAPREAPRPVPVAAGSAPAGVLGTRWGTPRAELAARMRAERIACRDADEYLFCARPLVASAEPVVATYEFCDGRLCAVALDSEATRDEAALARSYEALLGLMRRELGEPVATARRVGPGCRGHLALCLGGRRAEISAHWRWSDGAQSMVSAEQVEDDALQAQVSVTCLTGDRARRRDPEAAGAAGDGGAVGAGDATTPGP